MLFFQKSVRKENSDLASVTSDMTSKLKGTNGTNNSAVNAHNVNGVGIISIVSNAPAATKPSIEIDINPTTKKLVVYADTGSGSQLVGSINIT